MWDCRTPVCKKITFTELFFYVKFYSFAIGNKCKSFLHACEIVTAVALPLHHLMALLSCVSVEVFSEFNKRENIIFPGQLDSVLIADRLTPDIPVSLFPSGRRAQGRVFVLAVNVSAVSFFFL